MLTYNFENVDCPLYEYIYKCIKNDILSGVIKPNEKLPSKRTFSSNNGISIITIQTAYEQLISEGYVYTKPKSGYYVSKLPGMILYSGENNSDKNAKSDSSDVIRQDIQTISKETYDFDLSENGINPDNFPFSAWSKLMRKVMSQRKEELMKTSAVAGLLPLRQAIANHLNSFRGMVVNPDQIVIGAGTEYLYSLIIQLLGKDKCYGLENPGYKKLSLIYENNGADYDFIKIDMNGASAESLNAAGVQVAHICPNHHFPTGITMPVGRRYEILSWAGKNRDRYIIEDDYDSEFRLNGKPVSTLFSIDENEKVIYMNTFSKSLSPTIRISYMVLPVHLANEFYSRLSFYSCTVSNFEQYTLTEFINEGFFEKHINRMRLYYTKQYKQVTDILKESNLFKKASIINNDSGLHFLLRLDTTISDAELKTRLKQKKVKMLPISDYYNGSLEKREHLFIINYSNISLDNLSEAFERIYQCLI